MKANFNSFTAKLYRWFYIKRNMPDNLCPYFWKCVFMYLLLIPYSIVSLPFILVPPLEKCGEFNKMGERFWSGIGIWGVLSVIFCVLFTTSTIWFADKVMLDKYEVLYVIGILVWFACFVVGLVELIKYIHRKIEDRSLSESYTVTPERTESLFKAFILAKYHKYCPKIEWK